jgi:hypothetical protein
VTLGNSRPRPCFPGRPENGRGGRGEVLTRDATGGSAPCQASRGVYRAWLASRQQTNRDAINQGADEGTGDPDEGTGWRLIQLSGKPPEYHFRLRAQAHLPDALTAHHPGAVDPIADGLMASHLSYIHKPC